MIGLPHFFFSALSQKEAERDGVRLPDNPRILQRRGDSLEIEDFCAHSHPQRHDKRLQDRRAQSYDTKRSTRRRGACRGRFRRKQSNRDIGRSSVEHTYHRQKNDREVFAFDRGRDGGVGQAGGQWRKRDEQSCLRHDTGPARASVEAEKAGQRNPLIQLVNPKTQITEDIRKKLNKVLDGDDSVTFVTEKKAIAYNPIRIETVSDYDLFRSAETKKRDGTTMFDDEKRVYDNMGGNPQRAEKRLEHQSGGRASHHARWPRVAHSSNTRVCGSGWYFIPPDGSDWCKNITPNVTTVYEKSMPYETVIPMKGTTRSVRQVSLRQRSRVCRMTAGGSSCSWVLTTASPCQHLMVGLLKRSNTE